MKRQPTQRAIQRNPTAALVRIVLLPVAVTFLPASLASAEGVEKAQPIEAWKQTAASILEDMRRTVRRRDQLAFQHQLAGLVDQGAEPRDAFLKELGGLLNMAPAGPVLIAVVRKLVNEGSPKALSILFEALSRPLFEDVAGNEVGEVESERRRRVIELYVLQLGDMAQRARESEPPPRVLPVRMTQSLDEKLIEELGAANDRRARCAAYLLGGTGRKDAALPLAQALAKFEKSPFTAAVLVEALGRTNPEAAPGQIEAAGASRSETLRLAAIPVLGLLKGKGADDLIKEASEAKSWFVRRAAVEACRLRRDLFGMDILMNRYPKETTRLQLEIIEAAHDITQGSLPPDPKEWAKWWATARKGFQAPPRGKEAGGARGKTGVVGQPTYFGIEVWSSQLAILCDVSGSMSSSNLNLGSSGVQVAGAMKEGAPIQIAKDQISRLLKTVPAKTLFNVIAYNQTVKAFKDALLPATKPNVQAAVKFVDGLKADGGTNINDSLMKALKDPSVDTIYLLSDGEPTDGARTDPDDILEAVQMVNRFRKTRIYTFQIGEDQDLMKELASASGGRYKLLAVTADAGDGAKKEKPEKEGASKKSDPPKKKEG